MKSMMQSLLHARLQRVARRQRRLRLWHRLAAYWAAAAVAVGAVFLLTRALGLSSPWLFPVLGGATLVGALGFAIRLLRTPADLGAAVAEIERQHPELEGLLLTASQVQPGNDGRLNFLAERLLQEAAERSLRTDWSRAVPGSKFALAHLTQLAALTVLALALWAVRLPFTPGAPVIVATRTSGIEVTPGDSSLERGTSFVVLVRFGSDAPEAAELVLGTNAATARRIPLVRSLGDPVFGATVPDLNDSFSYHIAYAGKRTRDYRVAVFEYPRLERSDADVTYPAYTGLPPKHIDDTKRITAVERSRLALSLQLNKPVVAAALFARGSTTNSLPLRIETNRPAVALDPVTLTNGGTYELRLVDAEGRTNKVPAQFVFEVQPNRPPELKLKSPRGDLRPSPLEELVFDGTAWDDFGVLAYGLSIAVGTADPSQVELGRGVPAKDSRAFTHLLRLEELGLKPDQLVAWHVWADDYGPDGEIRRTNGDLFFGEIRPFEEIYREGEQMGGGGEGEQGDGNPTTKLAELQKQIINATWKLQRQQGPKPKAEETKPAPDAKKPGSAGLVPAERGRYSSASGHRGQKAEMKVGQPSPQPSLPGRGRTSKRDGEQPQVWLGFSTEPSAVLASATHSPAEASPGQSSVGSPWASGGFPLSPGERAGVRAGVSQISSSTSWMPAPVTFFGQRAGTEAEPREERNNGVARRLQSLVDSKAKAAPTGGYEADVTVVYDAMKEALAQAESSRERQQDPAIGSLWTAAIEQMQDALTKLDQAKSSPGQLGTALKAQQGAYEALLKVRDREFQVTRGQNRQQQGGGAGEEARQRQLEQLDLTQEENRYESQKQAQAQQNPQRREEQQVLNRLRELAQRQQDLNERLKELQTALQESKDEQEKEELRRQLKRLQEEQRQMLADTDELQQRMERGENQQRMSEQRQQLEQTRQDLQRASEATSQGNVSQALASGTRAQRQLLEMRDELRKKNSSGLSEEMRQMRAEARDLARREEDIAKQLADLEQNKQRSLTDNGERQKLADQLAQQRQRLTNLVNQASQLSEQAEATEPLVSRQLYDSIRKLTQDDGAALKQTQEELIQRGTMTRGLFENLQQMAKDENGKALGSAEAILREGFIPPARDAERRARATLDQLRKGVERATENVLGDDTEALRLAEKELEALAGQLERELGPAAGSQPGERGTNQVAGAQGGPARSGQRDASRTNSTARAGGGQSPETPPGQPSQPGQGEQPGNQQAQAGQTGEQNQPGEGQQPGQGQPGQRGQRGQRNGQNGQQQARDEGQPNPQEGQPSSQPGGQQPGQPSDQPGQQQAQQAGQQPGQQPGQGQGRQGGQGGRGDRRQQANQRGQQQALDLSSLDPSLANEGGGADGRGSLGGPITGEQFAEWSDRLRDVEEMVDLPDLRNEVSMARERARQMRQEFKGDRKKPDWAKVELQVVKPLVEVRQKLQEELARREVKDSLVPIDRDPVPARYSELVRRYYENLGKEK